MEEMTIIPSPVSTPEDVEAMRVIFNECRAYMTKHFEPITPEQQALWWKMLPYRIKRFKAFTYRHPDDEGIIAYSLLQWHHDGRITPLFGITARARGHNIAREIIRHYLSEADGPLHGEELSSHAAIIKLNQEAGWKLLREENGVRYLYHPNDKTEYPDYHSIVDYWSGKA